MKYCSSKKFSVKIYGPNGKVLDQVEWKVVRIGWVCSEDLNAHQNSLHFITKTLEDMGHIFKNLNILK
jgi:hypothetical protein